MGCIYFYEEASKRKTGSKTRSQEDSQEDKKDQVEHLKGKLETKTKKNPNQPHNKTNKKQTEKGKQNPHLMAAKRVWLCFCLKRWNLTNVCWCEELIECEVPVCEWCVLGAPGWASLQTKDLWSRWWAGCGLGSREDRGALPVLGDVCVLALVTFCLQHLKRRKGTQLFVFVLHVSTTRRCCWRQCLIYVSVHPDLFRNDGDNFLHQIQNTAKSTSHLTN